MASLPIPQSEPQTIHLQESAIAELTPIEPPPAPDVASPPPPENSLPPPIPSSPPPTSTSSPPPVTPELSPPPSPIFSPPPAPQVASSPPPPYSEITFNVNSLGEDNNPPTPPSPPPPSENTLIIQSLPTFASSPPPQNTPSPSFFSPPPVSTDSQSEPELEPATVNDTSPTFSSSLFVSPAPPTDNNSLSPPTTPPVSTTSPPPSPSTNTSNSSPKNSPESGNHSSNKSNASVNSTSSPPSDESTDHAARTGAAVGIAVAAVIIGFMLAVLFVQRRRKRHKYNNVYTLPSPYNSSPVSGSSFVKGNGNGGGDFMSSPPDAGIGNAKSWFSYEELTDATNGFASQNIIGSGGFGCVYKGLLPDGREVAVKKLKDNSGQRDREFKAEVEIISRVHHRYLVSLVGYCIADYQRLLVYEYVPNGTLHYHLHSSNQPPMAWPRRVKVACGSARGIAYLHEDCFPRIIHRDIKSPNILVDNNFDAKVADFGLAKLAQELESNSHISTRVMGTFGYMAPEYASSGKLTEKSDVFSFGVVLLEIITGRKPVDETRPLGDESLVEWARPLLTESLEHGSLDELADPRLQGNYDRDEMFRLIEAAAACVRHSAVKRPKMSQVVRTLDAISEQSDLSNGIKPGQSGIYDSREQSAEIRLFQRMTFESQDNWPSSQVADRRSQV